MGIREAKFDLMCSVPSRERLQVWKICPCIYFKRSQRASVRVSPESD